MNQTLIPNGTNVFVKCEQTWGRITKHRDVDDGVVYRVSGVERGEFTRDELITDLEFNQGVVSEIKAELDEHEANEPTDEKKRLGHWWTRRNQLLDSLSFYESNVRKLSTP